MFEPHLVPGIYEPLDGGGVRIIIPGSNNKVRVVVKNSKGDVVFDRVVYSGGTSIVPGGQGHIISVKFIAVR